ncbi:hypothetical protein CAPP_04965 [Corynebacterium appendicis CIP 107643]|nr:hypothetical protein CAPP_04965 [Corynebacterium appendicis CIP 107643]
MCTIMRIFEGTWRAAVVPEWRVLSPASLRGWWGDGRALGGHG